MIKNIRNVVILFPFLLLSSCFNTAKSNLEIYFSPNIKKHLITEINSAKNSIDIAIYVFTDRDVADALNRIAKRGVKVRVLFGETSDQFSSSVDESLVPEIEKKKDGIHKFESDGIMHNKFAVIDENTVITGSYNWTYSANAKNNENLIIIRDNSQIARKYEDEFTRLWRRGRTLKTVIAKGKVNFNNPADVKMHVGEYVNGVGIVENVGYSKRSGTYFLNFGAGRGGFTIVIFRRTASAYKNNRGSIFNLKGKTVKCYGKIKYYKKYGYEIILNNYKNLELLND